MRSFLPPPSILHPLSSLLLVLAGVAGGRTDEAAPHRLAATALRILNTHCSACHGHGAVERGKVRIAAHGRLFGDRGLIIPGDADASTLLTRIEVGSMPPGERPRLTAQELQSLRAWVAAGAPPWHGTAYVVGHLLDDLRDVSADDRPFVRYVRLDHLWEAARADEVAKRRESLAAVLRHFSGVRRPLLTAGDAPGSVYRFDLRDLGWDRRPFHVYRDDEKGSASPLNLYDLLLLEYPLAEWPARLPQNLTNRLGKEYFRSAELVRPIPAVRGDWLARQALREPFDRELRRKTSEVPAPLGLEALRDLAFAGAPEPRTALLAVDALAGDDRTATFEPTFTTNKPDNVFRPRDPVFFLVENPTREDFWIEIVYTSARGEKSLVTGPVELRARSQLRFPPETSKVDYSIGHNLGTDFVTVLASRQRLPEGKVLRGDGLQDRFVHPYYTPDRGGSVETPTGVQVRTTPLKIVPADAKR